MTTHINDGGTWRQAREIHINDSGTWRRIREGWVNDGGTWRRFFSGVPLVQVLHTGLGGGEGIYVDPGATDRNIAFHSTGLFSTNSVGPGTLAYSWLLSGLASDVEIFFHNNGPDSVTGATLDTWLSLSSDRMISLPWPGGIGDSEATIQVSMRYSVTSEVLVSAAEIYLVTHP